MESKFKILDPYLREDAAIFFGREQETQEVFNKLFNTDLLLLYGASGTGKTSLLKCGVANLFQDTDWFLLEVRRKDNILNSLNKEIHEKALTPIPEDKTISEKLYSLYLDFYKPIYLVFDQFEELFISGGKQEQEEFIASLQTLRNSNLNLKIILSIREEYLANLTDFEKIIPDIFENKVRIERMSATKAQEVVTKTCSSFGIELYDKTKAAKSIIELLGSQKFGVELTYLQVLLEKLYEKAIQKNKKQVVFSKKIIESIGGVDDLLSDFLEEQLTLMEDRAIAWRILKTLISKEGTKLTRSAEQLEQLLEDPKNDFKPTKIKEYLLKFIDNKILHIINDKKEELYELAHDSLAKKIFESMSSEEKRGLELENFLMTSYKNYQINGGLLSQNDLDLLANHITHITPDKEVEDFITLSKKEILKGKRNRKLETMLKITGVFSILIITLLLFYQQTNLKDKLSDNDTLLGKLRIRDVELDEALKKIAETNNTTDSIIKSRDSIINKLFFYNDSLGLAKEGNRYGFIDKEGMSLIDFKYQNATAFDTLNGFAEVKRLDTLYLIDKMGNEYRLAYSVDSLDTLKSALDLRNKKLDSFPEIIFTYKHLKVLFLEGNSIDSIPFEKINKTFELNYFDLAPPTNEVLSDTIPSLVESEEPPTEINQ